jgi:hypothetical protein
VAVDAPELLAFGADVTGRFGTDLRSVFRLGDGAAIAPLDLPPGQVVGESPDAPPRIAGLPARNHRPTFSRDGALLADIAVSPAERGHVAIYETATGRRLGAATSPRLSIYGESLVSLAFSPDARRLAAQDWGGPGTLSLFCARP